MVDVARRNRCGPRFEVRQMTDLDLPVAPVAVLLGWQPLIQIADDEVPSSRMGHFRKRCFSHPYS